MDRFFIQNSEKCKIYDEDVFKENSTDSLELLDENIPEIVELSRSGSYSAVKALLNDIPPEDKLSMLNAGEVWTAGDHDRLGGDTALAAAAKEGHLEVVGALLLEGADPTIEHSTLQGRRESARQGVKARIKYVETFLSNVVSEKVFIYDSEAWKEPEEVIKGKLDKLSRLRKCLDLIRMVEKQWKKAKALVRSREPKLKALEKIQAKILAFLDNKDGGNKEQNTFSVKRLIKSYRKLLLQKRVDLLCHKLRQNKRNIG